MGVTRLAAIWCDKVGSPVTHALSVGEHTAQCTAAACQQVIYRVRR